MKKLGLLVIPLMAISFLTNCGGGSSPKEDVKFSAQSEVTLDKHNKKAVLSLNWTPTDHSIECSDFTFTLNNQSDITSNITLGELGSRPLKVTIDFAKALEENDKGDLKFKYNDKTAKKEGEGKVTGINVKLHENPPTPGTYTISMLTEGTTISPGFVTEGDPYYGEITVTDENKMLDGDTLKSVKLKDSGDDITSYCEDYDPKEDYKSATFTIPAQYITEDIEVEVNLKDKPAETGTVIWNNWNDTPLVEPYELTVGLYAEYKGDTPTRPTTSSYVYQFSGWDPDPTVTPIVGGEDNVFKAQFDPVATTNLAANMKLVIPSGNADLTFSFDCTASKKITVDWGDSAVDNNKSHTYSKSGTYNVGIYGEDITTVSAGEKGKDYLSELTLKDKITAIPDNAFKSCTSLTKATVPSSVTSLGEYAFAYCTSLSEISNLTNITSISAHAFDSCALTTFSVQTKTTEIGDYAFNNCTSLETVYTTLAYDTLKTIGAHAFESCKITSIVIPGNVTSIGDYAFSCCDELAIVQCASDASLTSIGKGAFYDCSLLSTMEIPDAIISVGADAFTGCNLTYTTEGNCRYLPGKSGNQYLLLVKASNDQITSATIHNSCNVVCGDAFRFCTELTTINIPNNVRSIGDSAFRNCSSLSTATISSSSSLVTIGNNAFYGCSKLTNINIPNGVTSIGNNAFQSCNILSTATISSSSSLVTIGEYAFYGCSKLTEITIPDKVTLIGNSAFSGCSELSKATISSSSSLVTIGDYAFTSCKKLKTIYIPKKVTSIGAVAFQNCSILETVDLTAFVIENPDNIPNLGAVAFVYCEALEALKVANDKMVKIFQEKDGWSTYADKIVAA